MKLAVYSESSADEAAIRILVEGILGRATVPVALNQFEMRRGWTSVLSVAPVVLRHLHYQTDAEALVVVLDSDKTPVHQPQHDQPGEADSRCRLCLLRERLRQTQTQLKLVPGRSALRIGLGLAVPTIEAWFRCGHDRHVTEAAWLQALQSGHYPYDGRRLKRDLYQTDRPSLDIEKRRLVEEARRLVQNIAELEKWFPNGFGPLAREVRSW